MRKRPSNLKEDYLNGLKLFASFGIATLYFIIMATVAVYFPFWVAVDILPHINNVLYVFFVVTPITLILGVFMGYHWWWVCKNYLQHYLGSWCKLEL